MPIRSVVQVAASLAEETAQQTGKKRKKIEDKEEKKQAAKILSGIGVDSPGGGTSESTSESGPHPLKIWAAKSIHAFGRGWAGRHKKALEQVPSAERGD